MRKVLERCPSCGGELVITEVECKECGTQVRSRYSPCAFCSLTADELAFVKLFVEKRGNLRETEKALGVSYPTVRGKLEEIAEKLAGGAGHPEPAAADAQDQGSDERREVLRLVAGGQLSAQEALERLRAAGGPREE